MTKQIIAFLLPLRAEHCAQCSVLVMITASVTEETPQKRNFSQFVWEVARRRQQIYSTTNRPPREDDVILASLKGNKNEINRPGTDPQRSVLSVQVMLQ